MPTLRLDQPGGAARTHSTELIRDPFSHPYAIDRRGQLIVENIVENVERLSNPISPSLAVDALAAALVGRTALHSISWNRALPTIGAHLEFSAILAGAVEALVATWRPADEVVEDLWEGLVRPRFKPMYGHVTRADRTLVSMSTSGRIRSREVQPEYEDED